MTVDELAKIAHAARVDEGERPVVGDRRVKGTSIVSRLERFSGGTAVEFRGGLDEDSIFDAPVLIAMKEDGSAVVVLPE